MNLSHLHRIFCILGFCLSTFLSAQTVKKQMRANDDDLDESDPAVDYEGSKGSSQQLGNGQVRQFHDVLNDLLTEFAYDVRSGQLKGLKNLAIRRVEVSQTLPKSYDHYVELLVSEKIRENSQVRLINCVPCKVKSSSFANGKIVINSPTTSIDRMDEAATQMRIENFMDVILVYHTTHMVLAFNIFDTGSKELTWTRTYNSETIRSRYQKMAVDYKQVEKGRSSDEYEPEYRLMFGLGYANVPNINATDEEKKMFFMALRTTEKFNNRRDEFGLLLHAYFASSSFIKSYPTTGSSTSTTTTDDSNSGPPKATPFKQAFHLGALYAHNFVGDIERYDRMRYGVHFGGGLFYAPGYLTPQMRTGFDVHLGKRFAVSTGLFYNAESEIEVAKESVTVPGGVGIEFGVSYNF